MRDTPMVDAMMKFCFGTDEEFVRIKDAAKLERELNAANERIKQLENNRIMAAANSLANMLSYEDAVAKIKRLEEAGDKMADLLDGGVFMKLAVQWHKAKEAKP